MKKLILLSVILLSGQLSWGMSDADANLLKGLRKRDTRLFGDAYVAGADLKARGLLPSAVTLAILKGDERDNNFVQLLLQSGAGNPDDRYYFNLDEAMGVAQEAIDNTYDAYNDEQVASAKSLMRLLEKYDPRLNSDE